MKITTSLAKLDAKMCIVQAQASEHAKLDLRLRALELSMARCGQCQYTAPNKEADV